MSSTSGNGSSERGFLSFHSLSVEVLQRAVLRGGGGIRGEVTDNVHAEL